MVRNVDDFDFCLPSHAQGVLEGLQQLRANPKLSDVTLVAGGREFSCHRGVLALCSHYFHAMFSGDFAESIAARVELKEVDPGALEMLLDFAYTGKVTINQGNVEGLMRTSSQLHFPTIQKVCSRYLRQQMDATNCLGICEFGESHGCPEVSSKAWSFLQENFEAVSQQEEFLQLSKERLTIYLSNDQLQVQEEQSLAEAVLRWVRHDPGSRAQFLPELLELAHLISLPDQYLQNLLATEPLIRDSDASKALVTRSRATGQSDASAQKNPLTPPQKLEEVLVVVGGRVLEENEDEDGGVDMPVAPRNFAFYNPKSRRWMALPDFPDYNKWGFSLVALNNDVYVTGGSRGSQNDTWSTTQAWCFCPRDGAWNPIASMLKARTNHTSAVLNGEIYVIGDLWSVITSPFIPKYLSAPRCATLHGLIYLIGDNTKKVYMYNPEANIWQKVAGCGARCSSCTRSTKTVGWCHWATGSLSLAATGRAWMGTTVWRWRCMTAPRTSGHGRAPCPASGSSTAPPPFSWTPPSGRRLSRVTMGCRRTHSVVCHSVQPLSPLSSLPVQLFGGGDENPSARLAGALGACSPPPPPPRGVKAFAYKHALANAFVLCCLKLAFSPLQNLKAFRVF
ncbi:kelch-like protein 30 isoform X2 [Grus americana]|uniref:kelch-like protein 30 isoform X2 n=1 Tax=Grus americana TaxID=9117 RepID=UPI0024079B17|nr:kelch-like protein 30 isoform X2 [Grus americana]